MATSFQNVSNNKEFGDSCKTCAEIPEIEKHSAKIEKEESDMVTEETCGRLRDFFWQHVELPVSIFGTMDGHFNFVTTGGSLPDWLMAVQSVAVSTRGQL